MTMPPSIESIEQAAMQLQPGARLELTHLLVQSLDALPEATLAELWLDEAQRRDVEMDRDATPGIPGETVFQRLRARYGK